jgi:predicted small metal-binding protein
MLRVTCADIGIEGCAFVAEGEKVRKVENKMMEHLREEHPSMIAGLTDVQHRELETRIRSDMHGLEPGVQPHEIDKHTMLRISCAAFGTTGCDFVAEDRKVRKVENRFFDHLRDRHPEIIAGLANGSYRELEHRVKEAIEHE